MKSYTYDEAVSFLENLPRFMPPENDGTAKKDFFSLDAEIALLAALGDPHKGLDYIHVAGTNGKGSCCAYISSILSAAGIRAGCFTSPYFIHYNEMLSVDRVRITNNEFARIFSEIKPACDELAAADIFPSEYEILTVMAFMYFLEKGCSIAVMEVNLGGRVDSTNVIPPPLVSVIAPIGIDHTSILGNTLFEIAEEKAGIIKQGTTVASAIQKQEVMQVLERVCEKKNADLDIAAEPVVEERSFDRQVFRDGADGRRYATRLLGCYQPSNASLALLAIRKLAKKGYHISDKAMSEGIADAEWFGRFSIIKRDPFIIADGSHNIEGALALRQSLEAYFRGGRITFVLGILEDKDVDGILDILLPLAKEVYTTAVPSPRTISPEDLAAKTQAKGVRATVMKDISGIKEIASGAEVICIAGSLYLLRDLHRIRYEF